MDISGHILLKIYKIKTMEDIFNIHGQFFVYN